MTARDMTSYDTGVPGLATPSTLRAMNDAGRALDKLLSSLNKDGNAQEAVLAIAASLNDVVARTPDLALATILLGQIAASYTVRHAVETALLTLLIARAQGKPEAELLSVAAAALTMNAGMLNYHEQYMSKRGLLQEEEIRTIRQHPQESVNLLIQAGVHDPLWLACVLQHHENPDGSGYPAGLRDIEENALLVSLADRYCASVSARNYRRSQLPDIALRELGAQHGNAANATYTTLLACFGAQIGAYPPGTRVRLRNGDTGVVTYRAGHAAAADSATDAPAADATAAPAVLALMDVNQESYAAPLARDCRQEAYAIVGALHEDQAEIRFSMRQLWGGQAALG